MGLIAPLSPSRISRKKSRSRFPCLLASQSRNHKRPNLTAWRGGLRSCWEYQCEASSVSSKNRRNWALTQNKSHFPVVRRWLCVLRRFGAERGVCAGQTAGRGSPSACLGYLGKPNNMRVVQYWRLVSTRKADLSIRTSRTGRLTYSRVVVDPCISLETLRTFSTQRTWEGPVTGCRLIRVV